MLIVMTYAGENGPSFMGPFPDQGTAADWGRQWSVNNNDDPRWQTMEIPTAYFNQYPTLNSPWPFRRSLTHGSTTK